MNKRNTTIIVALFLLVLMASGAFAAPMKMSLTKLQTPSKISPKKVVEYTPIVVPECNDAVDNDGDGKIDMGIDVSKKILVPADGRTYDYAMYYNKLWYDISARRSGTSWARLNINGEDTGWLRVGRSRTLSDGTVVTVRKILDYRWPQVGLTLAFQADADDGCESKSDDDETDPIYACDDGIDNDGDGLVDMADPGCDSRTDDDEYNEPACYGETFKIERSGDMLELNEKLGNVVETVDESDLSALDGFSLTTPLRTTDVYQYLRFTWGVDDADITPVYGRDDDDNVGDFLYARDHEPAFRYEMEFTEGFQSTIDAGDNLPDFVGQTLNIIGQDFSITAASFDGTELIIEMTDSTRNVELRDRDPTIGTTDGWMQIDHETIEDAEVNLMYSTFAGELRLNKITYTLEADGTAGEAYVAPGEGFKEKLDEPEGMLSDLWDIRYEGLSTPGTSEFQIKNSGSDKYRMNFHNTQGIHYNNIRLAYASPAGLRYGDNTDSLVFEQGSDHTDADEYTIWKNDYFVLTHNGDTDIGVSRILKVNSIDLASELVNLRDVGTGSTINAQYTRGCDPTVVGTCSGQINVSGYSYDFYVLYTDTASKEQVKLLVDNDDDGSVGGEATIVINGGGIIDLGEQTTGIWGATIPGDEFEMRLTTLASNLDEATSDEVITISLSATAGVVELDVPIDTSIGLRTYADLISPNVRKGMTNYGVFMQEFTDIAGPDDMEIDYPLSQLEPQVYVVAGEC